MGNDAGTRKISIQCRCGKKLVGPASAIGRTIMCTACGRQLRLASRSQSAPAKPPRIKIPDQQAEALADLASDVPACPGCGSELSAGAVLCVQCGYDLREGRVISRSSSSNRKTKRKTQFKVRLPRPAILVMALGAPLVIAVIGVGIYFASRKGSTTTAQASVPAVGGPTSRRAARPEPSRDPKDWQISFAAFAASLKAGPDPSGRQHWELSGGPVNLAQDSGKLQWEGELMGRDRRQLTSAARSNAIAEPFGVRFPEVGTLPEPFWVLFAIDESRAEELLKLSYRRIKL